MTVGLDELGVGGEGGVVGGVYGGHLGEGEGQDGDDVFDGGDFVQREGAAIAAFQVFFDDLVAADVEVPDGFWNGGDGLLVISSPKTGAEVD